MDQCSTGACFPAIGSLGFNLAVSYSAICFKTTFFKISRSHAPLLAYFPSVLCNFRAIAERLSLLLCNRGYFSEIMERVTRDYS